MEETSVLHSLSITLYLIFSVLDHSDSIITTVRETSRTYQQNTINIKVSHSGSSDDLPVRRV